MRRMRILVTGAWVAAWYPRLRLKIWNWLEFEMRGQDEPEPPKRAINARDLDA